MKKALFVAIAISIFVMLPALNSPAFAICTQQIDVGPIATDYTNQDTLIGSTDPYDPCDNYLSWFDKFYRTDVARGYTLRFHYNGTNQHHGYYSYNYQENQFHEFYATVYVGPSTSHRIVISKSNYDHGCFESIYAMATYVSGGGSGPEGP